jgi:hypothetical protein
MTMSAEVIEAPEAATKKQKSFTLTMEQLSQVVDEAVAKRLASLKDGQEASQQMKAMPVYPYPPKDGEIVPPGFMAPEGWQFIVMTDGTRRLHPKADAAFDALERKSVLSAVDKKWAELTKIVAGQPAPAEPKKLLINERFRKLFDSLRSWGDNCQVFDVADKDLGDDALSDGKSSARFKFVL